MTVYGVFAHPHPSRCFRCTADRMRHEYRLHHALFSWTGAASTLALIQVSEFRSARKRFGYGSRRVGGTAAFHHMMFCPSGTGHSSRPLPKHITAVHHYAEKKRHIRPTVPVGGAVQNPPDSSGGTSWRFCTTIHENTPLWHAVHGESDSGRHDRHTGRYALGQAGDGIRMVADMCRRSLPPPRRFHRIQKPQTSEGISHHVHAHARVSTQATAVTTHCFLTKLENLLANSG